MALTDYSTSRDANAAIVPGNIRAIDFQQQQIVNAIRQLMADLAGAGFSTTSHQTLATDANFTLTPGTSPVLTRHTGTLTADRTVTLSTTGAIEGQRFRITRTGGGAFVLNVGTGPLKALATNQWLEVVYNGTAWYLSAYGALTDPVAVLG